MVMTIEVNVTEMALDVKQILGESLESCFMTNYALHRPDGTPMHDYDTFEDCRQGDVFTMRFKKYDDKDMRYHVAHTQELVMVSLDHVMVSAVYTEPHHTPSPADQRSYPSLQKIMGSELKSVLDVSEGYRASYQAAMHSVEYAIDPLCSHSVGFTFQQEKKLIQARKAASSEMPDPGNFACAEDFSKDVTLDALYDMLNQISLQWSGYNPPPRSRRLQGDLGYLDVQFIGSAMHFVTCTPNGFYVNASKNKSEFNPAPGSKPCHSETLMGLLFQLNPRFKEKACELLRIRASLHPFETGALLIPNFPNWMEAPEQRLLPNGLSVLRSGESSPAVSDYHSPIRTWNDDIQQALEMPNDTYDNKLLREKRLARLHTEFIEFAMRVAMTVVDGQVAPINPHEPPETWVYVVNNVFISHAFDSRNAFSNIGGDKVARVLAKQDLHGTAAVRRTNTSLSTVTTALVDYKGHRMICQTLVPGFLIVRVDGKGGSPQVHGLSDEDNCGYLVDPEVERKCADLGRAMCIRSHTMRDPCGEEVNVSTSSDVKAMSSTDGRTYLLECSKLVPQDMNFPDDPLAFIRFELKDEFIKKHRVGPKYDELKQRIKKRIVENCAERDAKLRESNRPSTWGMHQNPASLHRIIGELEESFIEAEMLREMEMDDPPVELNTDLFSFTSGMDHTEGQDRLQKDEEVLIELAEFLRSKLPVVKDQLIKSEVIDTEQLKEIFHERGVNMRYLGVVASLLTDAHAPLRRLVVTEMISRVVKHKLRDLMMEPALEDVSAPMAALLSSVLTSHQAKPGGANGAQGGGSKKNKKKKKGKKGGGGGAAATDAPAGDAAAADPAAPVPPPAPAASPPAGVSPTVPPPRAGAASPKSCTDSPAASAAADPLNQTTGESVMGTTTKSLNTTWLGRTCTSTLNSTLSLELGEVLPPPATADWVSQAVWAHFKYRLPDDYMETAIVSRFILMRAVCCKVGLCIKQRVYCFDEKDCVEADDILDIHPIVHHHTPRYEVVDGLLDNCHNDDPEVMARRIHYALSHANQVVGAVCGETAVCYQTVAKVMLSLNDVESAIHDQCKALITTRRLSGATHGNLVPLLKTMGMMAHLSGRSQAAYLYFLRATYLSRVLCGDASLELLLTLVSFFHEVDLHDKSLHVLEYTMKRAQEQGTQGMLSLAACYQHQAMLVGPQGMVNKAIDAQKKALDLYLETLGQDDPRTKESESWYRYWVRCAVEQTRSAKGGKGAPGRR